MSGTRLIACANLTKDARDCERGSFSCRGNSFDLSLCRMCRRKYTIMNMSIRDLLEVTTPGGHVFAQGDRKLRISPIILRAAPDEIIRRRERLFDSLQSSKIEGGIRLNTVTTIPPTANRLGRSVGGSFLLMNVEWPIAAFVAELDSHSYLHSVERLEGALYPLAIKPYVPTDEVAVQLDKLADKFDCRLEVLHFRARSKADNSKLQLHGVQDLGEVLDRVNRENRVLEGIKVRAMSGMNEEVLRVRADSRCRLLIERWSIEYPPLTLVGELANRFLTSLQDVPTEEFSVVTSDFSGTSVPFRVENLRVGLMRVGEYLQREKGAYVSVLDEARGYPLCLVDFVSGVSCHISIDELGNLVMISDERLPAAFVERFRSIVSEIEGREGSVGR